MRRTLRTIRLVGVLFGAIWLVAACVTTPRAAELFWVEKDAPKIQRSALDGSGVSDLLTAVDGLNDPRGLALDVASQKMYWANNGTGTVHRANLDGTDIELLHSGLSSVGDLTLDLVGGKIYWAETSAGMIQRKNLDGSGAVENIITGANEPYYLALDLAADRVYWSELGGSGVDSAIRRAPIVGDGLEEIFVSALERPRGVQLDLVGGMVYWAERGAAPAIKRRNIDRSGVTETLFDAGDGLIRPHGVALDLEGGMIYWTDTTTASIQRGALDGTGSVEPLVPGLVGPWDIVAVPEPSTWTLLAVAALLLGACGPLRRRVLRTR